MMNIADTRISLKTFTFASIMVICIIFSESYKFFVLPVGGPYLLLIFLFSISWMKINYISKIVVLSVLMIGVYTGRSNNIHYMLQDVSIFFAFIVAYLNRIIIISHLANNVKSYCTLIFLVIIGKNLLILSGANYDWSGDLFITANANLEGLPRIIHKGIAPILLLLLYIALQKNLYFYATMTLLLIVLDGSRAFIALSMIFILLSVRLDLKYWMAILLAVVCGQYIFTLGFRLGDDATLYEVNSSIFGLNINGNFTMSGYYRILEIIQVIREVGPSFVFGGGYGASFAFADTGHVDGVSNYSHNIIAFLYLKGGLVGIFLFFFFIGKNLLNDGWKKAFYCITVISCSLVTNQLVGITGPILIASLIPMKYARTKT